MNVNDDLLRVSNNLGFILPELFLAAAVCGLLILGLLFHNKHTAWLQVFAVIAYSLSVLWTAVHWPTSSTPLFNNMFGNDDFASYFRILSDAGGIITILMTRKTTLEKPSEYFLLIVAATLGSHLLVMSNNFISVVLSLEIISLSSYALAGWSFSKQGAEGSVKYFLFGSVATAVMLYGMSLLFGAAHTLDFTSQKFFDNLVQADVSFVFVASLMVMAGFLFKTAAAPLHLWAPDVYQVAPTPVVAFFSTVPKLAAMGAMVKFILAINVYGQGKIDWQFIVAFLSTISIIFGNISALGQVLPKRMLAYSAVAQTGFLMVGLSSFSADGTFALLFYGAILLLMNFLTFRTIQQFEDEGITSIAGFAGVGRSGSFKAIALTVGLVSLVGLPVTAGFSAKLFIFSNLWIAYGASQKVMLLILLVVGLMNTVVSLFYYLKIPYYMFLKDLPDGASQKKVRVMENLLSAFLVILILALFFRPDFLMGWIIRINFVR